MFVLLTAALLGACATVAGLWSYGAVVAFAGAPLGASFLAALAGALLAWRRRGAEKDEMAAAGNESVSGVGDSGSPPDGNVASWDAGPLSKPSLTKPYGRDKMA